MLFNKLRISSKRKDELLKREMIFAIVVGIILGILVTLIFRLSWKYAVQETKKNNSHS